MNRPLTREERETLKRLVDEASRDRIRRENHPYGLTTCVGCGGDLEVRTIGCKTCWDRHRRRKRREDPVRYEEEKRRWRESSQRRRDRARGKLAA